MISTSLDSQKSTEIRIINNDTNLTSLLRLKIFIALGLDPQQDFNIYLAEKINIDKQKAHKIITCNLDFSLDQVALLAECNKALSPHALFTLLADPLRKGLLNLLSRPFTSPCREYFDSDLHGKNFPLSSIRKMHRRHVLNSISMRSFEYKSAQEITVLDFRLEQMLKIAVDAPKLSLQDLYVFLSETYEAKMTEITKRLYPERKDFTQTFESQSSLCKKTELELAFLKEIRSYLVQSIIENNLLSLTSKVAISKAIGAPRERFFQMIAGKDSLFINEAIKILEIAPDFKPEFLFLLVNRDRHQFLSEILYAKTGQCISFFSVLSSLDHLNEKIAQKKREDQSFSVPVGSLIATRKQVLCELLGTEKLEKGTITSIARYLDKSHSVISHILDPKTTSGFTIDDIEKLQNRYGHPQEINKWLFLVAPNKRLELIYYFRDNFKMELSLRKAFDSFPSIKTESAENIKSENKKESLKKPAVRLGIIKEIISFNKVGITSFVDLAAFLGISDTYLRRICLCNNDLSLNKFPKILEAFPQIEITKLFCLVSPKNYKDFLLKLENDHGIKVELKELLIKVSKLLNEVENIFKAPIILTEKKLSELRNKILETVYSKADQASNGPELERV
ncbi:MAG: hypothetical protein KDD56_10250, partial [Bdellovibrionales bacterium]|nr:hypothetical protein [Bdellovibrionales bacterium]